MSKKPRIVLLHGTPVAVEPIQKSFATRWPEAEVVNLLDDSLSVDRAKDHDLTPRMFERFMELGGYAQRIGADGILVTCSAFGPAIERMTRELPMPVLKPNEAMFKAAMTRGQRIGMLATFAPSVLTMTEEFDEFVRATGSKGTLKTIVVDGAMDAPVVDPVGRGPGGRLDVRRGDLRIGGRLLRRVVESATMRVTDLFFAFPAIILAMAVVAALGADLHNAVLAIIVGVRVLAGVRPGQPAVWCCRRAPPTTCWRPGCSGRPVVRPWSGKSGRTSPGPSWFSGAGPRDCRAAAVRSVVSGSWHSSTDRGAGVDGQRRRRQFRQSGAWSRSPAWPSSPLCWRSTSSVTPSATRWIRALPGRSAHDRPTARGQGPAGAATRQVGRPDGR